MNGLAILNEDSSVADYYRNNVIGGEGAFVITANDYESFQLAILEKLIKEIGGVPVAGLEREHEREPEPEQAHQRAVPGPELARFQPRR